jgi:hypothetical protein
MSGKFSILTAAALTGVLVTTSIASIKAVPDFGPVKYRHGNTISVHGLHVALPYGVKDFPVEIVPLP